MQSTEPISLTDSEQDLYNLMTDTQKKLYDVWRLTRKVEQRELLTQLQDVTEAVKEIRVATDRQKNLFKSFLKWLKDVMKYAVSIFKIDE